MAGSDLIILAPRMEGNPSKFFKVVYRDQFNAWWRGTVALLRGSTFRTYKEADQYIKGGK